MMKKILAITALAVMASSAMAQQVNYGTGLQHNADDWKHTKFQAPLTRETYANLPSAASLQKWTPVPASQGTTGTCVAWAATYCAATVCWAQANGVTDRKTITQNAMLPALTYLHIKNTGDNNCSQGSIGYKAAAYIKQTGCLKYNTNSEKCCISRDPSNIGDARQNRIVSYETLFQYNEPTGYQSCVEKVKKALSEGRVCTFGMKLPNSFMNTSNFSSDGLYRPTENLKSFSSTGGHAMCIVAYDDNKFGGAFLVQNSWGSSWCLHGYFWIDYYTFANTVYDSNAYYVPIKSAPNNTVDYNTNHLNFNTYSQPDCQVGNNYSDFEVIDDNNSNNNDDNYDDNNNNYNDDNNYVDNNNDDNNYYDLDDNNYSYDDDDDYYYDDDNSDDYDYDDDYNDYYNDDDNDDWDYDDDYDYDDDDYDYYQSEYDKDDSEYEYEKDKNWVQNYNDYCNKYNDIVSDFDEDDDFVYVYGNNSNVSRGITPKGDTVDVYKFSGNIKLVLNDNTCMVGELNKNGVIEMSNKYKSGTRFRVYVGNNQPCFVYVFGTDLSNKTYNIFPQSKIISAFLPYKNSCIAFPDERHYIEMDNQDGTDYLYILYSLVEINTQKLMKRMEQIPGDYETKIFKALGPKAFSIKDAKFSGTKQFRFSSSTPKKETMVAIVKFQHVK